MKKCQASKQNLHIVKAIILRVFNPIANSPKKLLGIKVGTQDLRP